jgi:hypothetical protein
MRCCFFLIVLLTCVVVLPLHGQTSENPPSPIQPAPGYVEQTDQFFASVLEGRYREAVDLLYSRNPWSAQMKDQISILRGQFVSLPDLAGELHGYELVVEQKFADTFVYRWYIVAYDRTPVSFHFTFYKPAGTWYLYSFEYKEDLKALSEELGKMKLLFPGPASEDTPGEKSAKPASQSLPLPS